MYSALPLKLACHSWFSGLRRSSHIHKAFGIAPNEKDSTCLVTTGAIHKYFTSSDPQRDDLFCHSFWHLIWKYIYNYIYMAYIFWHSILAFYLTFYSDILLWHSIRHSLLTWALLDLNGKPTDIWLLPLDPNLALSSGARGWGPAVPTEI